MTPRPLCIRPNACKGTKVECVDAEAVHNMDDGWRI